MSAETPGGGPADQAGYPPDGNAPLVGAGVSPTLLVGVNVISALLGLVQSVLVARFVGPGGLGVVAVLVATNGAVANVLDIRLFDVAAALFFERRPSNDIERHRRSVVQLCIFVNSVLALAMVAMGWGVAWIVGPRLLDAHLEAWWLAAAALSISCGYLSATLFGIQRLTGELKAAAWFRLLAQLAGSGFALPVILIGRDLDAYFLAIAVAAVVSLAVNGVALLVLWQRSMPTSLLDLADMRYAWPALRSRTRSVIGANVYAYSKVVHRSGDTLLVAALGSDAAAGLYRLARTVTDYMYVVYDGVNQAYFPKLLDELARGEVDNFRRFATRIAALAAGATIAILVLGALVLPGTIDLVVTDAYSGAVPSILILVIPFFFVAGLHLWMWPLLLHLHGVGRLARWSVMGALVQVAVTVLLAQLNGFSSVDGALGYLSFYIATYVPLLRPPRISPGDPGVRADAKKPPR